MTARTTYNVIHEVTTEAWVDAGHAKHFMWHTACGRTFPAHLTRGDADGVVNCIGCITGTDVRA